MGTSEAKSGNYIGNGGEEVGEVSTVWETALWVEKKYLRRG